MVSGYVALIGGVFAASRMILIVYFSTKVVSGKMKRLSMMAMSSKSSGVTSSKSSVNDDTV